MDDPAKAFAILVGERLDAGLKRECHSALAARNGSSSKRIIQSAGDGVMDGAYVAAFE